MELRAWLRMLALPLLLWPIESWASSPIVYPAKGQTLDQQSADEGQCRSWAQNQTHFDPASSPTHVAASAPAGGGIVRGGARGAALGAVGGAIGGDAGKGAAIGAGVGATAGLLNRGRARRETAHAQEQANEQYTASRSDYYRAFSVCMEGRGYTVK